MLKTMLKPKSAEPASDFEAAKTRWAKIDAKRRELIEQSDGIRLAQNYAVSGIDKRVPEAIRAKADPYMKLAGGRPKKLAEKLADVLEEIEDSNPKYQEERELYQAACRRETSQIALDLQPRHRAAVKAIARGLEALSLAMAEETEIRAELASAAPEGVSAFLPDCSSYLQFGDLSNWHTPASLWARHMRKIGILE